jgi:serine phosphatase RsbU (regulator of sigma subunit)
MHESLLQRARVDRDLRLAEQIQRRFLPQSVPTVPGYEFFAHYRAAYEVGGDYYDFVPLPDGRLALTLGDVAGKGVAAALMMAKFSGDTRYCVLTEKTPAAAGDRLNELLFNAGLDDRFITMCLGVLDPAANTFTFCSAGHLPVLVRRVQGHVDSIGTEISGFPLGIMPISAYEQDTIDLHEGDLVLIYSDGVTDGRNAQDDQYDTSDNPRLTRRLASASGNAETVGRAILQDIREYTEGKPQFDDLTMICFGRVSGGKEPGQTAIRPSP